MINNESKTEPKKVFLLDLGSALTKIGFSSNIYPSIICNTSYCYDIILYSNLSIQNMGKSL